MRVNNFQSRLENRQNSNITLLLKPFLGKSLNFNTQNCNLIEILCKKKFNKKVAINHLWQKSVADDYELSKLILIFTDPHINMNSLKKERICIHFQFCLIF